MGWNPDGSGVYAVGSYNGTVGFYTDESPGPIDILSMGEGRRHGLTQVTFSPCGRYLYTTCRRGGTISCWDVRATGECLWQGDRQGDTNQRLGFSLSSDGRLLSAGDLEGNVFLWKDILEVTEEGNSDPSPYSFKAHQGSWIWISGVIRLILMLTLASLSLSPSLLLCPSLLIHRCCIRCSNPPLLPFTCNCFGSKTLRGSLD